MISLEAGIMAAKSLLGIKTRTPPWGIWAFVLGNENGTAGVYVDSTGVVRAYPLSGQTVGNPILNSQSATNQVLASASGAVVVQNSTVVITKTGSLAALTLPAPTTAQNGARITFTSMTAYAHTITCPSAIVNNGVTGDPFTVITLAAFAGGGLTLEAYGGFWQVVANTLSTFA